MPKLGWQCQMRVQARDMQSRVTVTESGNDLGHPHNDLVIGQFGNLSFQVLDRCVEFGLWQDMERLEVNGLDRRRELSQIVGPLLV